MKPIYQAIIFWYELLYNLLDCYPTIDVLAVEKKLDIRIILWISISLSTSFVSIHEYCFLIHNKIGNLLINFRTTRTPALFTFYFLIVVFLRYRWVANLIILGKIRSPTKSIEFTSQPYILHT